ncbi:MAG: IS1380 family transposase [Bacteroidales bacterium]|nr:IS1380 family transposase [Bacteroidales bacterium]
MSKITTNSSTDQKIPTLFDLGTVDKAKVELSFDAPDISSMGGLLLTKADPAIHKFLSDIASCIEDTRTPYLVRHSVDSLIHQRVGQIACGFEDANDCDALRQDSLLKLFCGLRPDGEELGSQPTMTRLENGITARELIAIGKAFVDCFIRSYDVPPKFIILDFDDANANTNTFGAQQLSLFNAYYKEYCLMPLLIFGSLTGKLILPVLRPGRRNKSINVGKLIIKLILALHAAWPHTKILFRGDSHFCCHEFMDWARDKKYVSFTTGLAANSILLGRAAKQMERAREQYSETHRLVRTYASFTYRAQSWLYEQRVICKVEVSDMGENIRFIVTSNMSLEPKPCYLSYCQRGDCELDIRGVKELRGDKMSCHKFLANTFRLFMYAAAYVVLHMLKTKLFKVPVGRRGMSNKCFIQQIMLSAAYVKTFKGKIKISLSPHHRHRRAIEAMLSSA